MSLIALFVLLPDVGTWFQVRDGGVSLGTGVDESVRFAHVNQSATASVLRKKT